MESMVVRKSSVGLGKAAHVALWVVMLTLLAVIFNASECPAAVQKLTLLYPLVGIGLGASV